MPQDPTPPDLMVEALANLIEAHSLMKTMQPPLSSKVTSKLQAAMAYLGDAHSEYILDRRMRQRRSHAKLKRASASQR